MTVNPGIQIIVRVASAENLYSTIRFHLKRIYLYLYVFIYTYTHTHTHTHIYIYIYNIYIILYIYIDEHNLCSVTSEPSQSSEMCFII